MMQKKMGKSLMSLLLAAVMTISALPGAAFAAEVDQQPQEAICTEENCTHEHDVPVSAEAPEVEDAITPESDIGTEPSVPSEETEAPTIPTEEPVVPDTSEEPSAPDLSEDSAQPETPPDSTAENNQEVSSPIVWELEGDGTLYISGSGYVPCFTSADQQPWKDVRTQITGVTFDTGASLTIENIAYWFSGCTNLAYAELPDYVQAIGHHAFYNCQALHNLYLCHTTKVPAMESGAFITNHPLNWEPDYDPRLQISLAPDIGEALMTLACSYDWGSDNCPVHIQIGSEAVLFSSATTFAARASGYCSSCGKTCGYTLDYEQWTSSVHCIRHWCSNYDTFRRHDDKFPPVSYRQYP